MALYGQFNSRWYSPLTECDYGSSFRPCSDLTLYNGLGYIYRYIFIQVIFIKILAMRRILCFAAAQQVTGQIALKKGIFGPGIQTVKHKNP